MIPLGSPSSFKSGQARPSRGRSHQRTGSNDSASSALSTQSAPVGFQPPQRPPIGNRTTSYAPDIMPTSPGRKMAEDMAAAVAMAQAAMQRRSPPVSPSASLAHRRRGSADSDMSSIGSIMMGSPPNVPLPEVPEDMFEYDSVLSQQTLDELTSTYLNLPDDEPQGLAPPDGSRSRSLTPRPMSPRSQWLGAPEYPGPEGYQGPLDINSIASRLDEMALPDQLVRPPENHPRHPGLRFGPMLDGGQDSPAGTSHTGPLVPRNRTNPFREVAKAQNAVAITWRGDRRQTFALATTEAHVVPLPGEGVFPIDVLPGTSQVVEVPGGWAGRVQRLTGRIDEPATYCELTFDGFKGMTFFNVSYIHGHNGPVLMYPWVGEGRSGSAFRAAQVAPAGATTRDSGGLEVVCGTVDGPAPRRALVRRFYQNFDFQPAHHGAISPGDDVATQATHCRHIVCDFT